MNKNLLRKLKNLKQDDVFLMTVTVPKNKRDLKRGFDTFIFVNKFPYAEMESTKKMIVKLINEAKAK
jgi:hypothetical protein